MSLVDNNIKKLNIILPDPKGPVGAYVATKITGKLLFISGQVSIDKDAKLITGKIGKDLNLIEANDKDIVKGFRLLAKEGLYLDGASSAIVGSLKKIKQKKQKV